MTQWHPRLPSNFFSAGASSYETVESSHKILTRGPLKAESVWRPGSVRTCWGSLSAPPDPLAAIFGLLLRGGGGEETGGEEQEGGKREGKGRGGHGKGKGEKGRGCAVVKIP